MGKFNAIFNRAHDYTEMELQKPIPASECSVRGFIHSMNELHSIE